MHAHGLRRVGGRFDSGQDLVPAGRRAVAEQRAGRERLARARGILRAGRMINRPQDMGHQLIRLEGIYRKRRGLAA